MNKKIWPAILAVFIFAAIVGGCGEKQGKTDEKYQEVFEEFHKIIQIADQESALMSDLLHFTLLFTEHPTEESLDQCIEFCERTARIFNQNQSSGYELSEELKNFMLEREINITDFQTFDQELGSMRVSYQSTIKTLLYYLDLAKVTGSVPEELTFSAKTEKEIHENFNQLTYLQINGLFQKVPEDQLIYLEEHILKELHAFTIEGLPWENDEQVLSSKADLCMRNIEQVLTQYSNYLAEQEKKLYTEQKQVKDSLKEEGMSESELAAYFEQLNELSKGSLADKLDELESRMQVGE